MIVMYKAENVTLSQPSPQPQVLQRLPHLSYVYVNMLFRFLMKMRLYTHTVLLSGFSDEKYVVEILPHVALLYLNVSMVFLCLDVPYVVNRFLIWPVCIFCPCSTKLSVFH